MNLQMEINSLKQRIAELEEQAKEEQEDEFPQYGDNYYYIQSNGGVDWFQWDESGFDLLAQDIGNVFRTKEQAEFAVEKLKVEAELRKFSRPFENGKFNYYISLSVDDDVVEAKVHFIRFYCSQGTIYFESEEKAQKAIEAVGEERIKKYIFGVEG